LALGTHRGVIMQETVEKAKWKKNDPQESYEHFAANDSVDTDVAINFGRFVHCVRIPIHQEQLQPIVDYANGLNDHYFKTQNYKWSVLHNSCAHFVNNLLAAIGFWGYTEIHYGLAGDLYIVSSPWENLAEPGASAFYTNYVANNGPLG